MSLHTDAGARKYLTAAERRRFVAAARQAPPEVGAFCLLLAGSGCRVSELLAVTPHAFDFDGGVVTFETLKRRRRGVTRRVPVPLALLRDLDHLFGLRALQRDPRRAGRRLWGWSRTTAWRKVKAVMLAADICGTQASPKGLRHSFGVGAFLVNVPPHIVQRWLGHASSKTTAIYGDVMGREERLFAARMWKN